MKKWIGALLLLGIFGMALAINHPAETKQTTLTSLPDPCDPQRDSLALVAMYNALNGSNWTNPWPLDQNFSTWSGVTTNVEGCVIELKLSMDSLEGNLPDEIGNLKSLQVLHLDQNKITGPIPTTISELTELTELRIHTNMIEGEIPDGISNLKQLRNFSAANNMISGTLPEGLGGLDSLGMLILSQNEIQGSIPPILSNLSKLRVLDLSSNQLSGPVPASLGLLEQLEELILFQNLLSGELPNTLTGLSKLRRFWAFNNLFRGAIPNFTGQPILSLRLEFNLLSHMPDMSGLLDTLGNVFPSGVYVHYNKLTYEDIIPNLPLSAKNFDYSPQDSVGAPDTLYVLAGDTLRYDLNIDKILTTSVYEWFRNDTSFYLSDGSELLMPSIGKDRSGVYHCIVNNFDVPDLTLNSHKIKVNIIDTSSCSEGETNCFLAPRFCGLTELNEHCGILPDRLIQSIPNSLCNGFGVPENATYYKFIAPQNELAIQIIPLRCEGAGQAGIQAAIYNSCDIDFAQVIACQPDCLSEAFHLRSSNFVAGQEYILILDGCNGNSCEYYIEIDVGNADFQLQEIDSVSADSLVCLGELVQLEVPNAVPSAHTYVWELGNGSVVTTMSPQAVYLYPEAGKFEMCVTAVSDCDSTEAFCVPVRVPEKFEADTVIEVCNPGKSAYTVGLNLIGGKGPYILVEGMGTFDSINGFFPIRNHRLQ